ncbi:hypothetical protein Sme01_38800 [Sphaerisporangium melleum]|uniref:Histidine kinase/HSP90-like ATPase domain-containing protein n=1 Tax=Sphaerisporangium melleum TaxID=321316 RepID=A0A917R2E0_9ACTN|nr:ATP-binding protein [Sphaerisporangium melleum]GGK85616.1 hypothetical protein GCM10007964_30210 [Sphaerisporangium melleum]GII71404.1 hypothetical protein Sme01_38800 [Sphaerisporangium melleum]
MSDKSGIRTACWDVAHDPAAVSGAREQVKEVLTTWGLDDLADDVVLVVAELLSNAIRHGAPPIRLSLWGAAEDLCVRVTDHGEGRPRQLPTNTEAVHGRGLPIIAALAHDFGVVPHSTGPGKTIWARWPLTDGPPRTTVAAQISIPRSRPAPEGVMPTANDHESNDR